MVYDLHIFVCQRKRELPKTGCGDLGSEALRLALKAAFKEKNLKANIRVNESSCLGQCEKGPVVVAYPQGQWFYHVQMQQIPDMVEKILKSSLNKNKI